MLKPDLRLLELKWLFLLDALLALLDLADLCDDARLALFDRFETPLLLTILYGALAAEFRLLLRPELGLLDLDPLLDRDPDRDPDRDRDLDRDGLRLSLFEPDP